MTIRFRTKKKRFFRTLRNNNYVKDSLAIAVHLFETNNYFKSYGQFNEKSMLPKKMMHCA